MHYLNNYSDGFGNGVFLGLGLPIIGSILIVLIVWSLIWKGLALWHSARRGDWIWFLIFLVLNTAGILEIVYLFVVAKIKLGDLLKKTTHSA